MKEYVLGFAFSRNKEKVVLINKLRPDWQKGSLNGVGGKVEPEDLGIHFAMVREFKEETGVATEEDMWNHFATMTFENDVMGGVAKVYCFRMFSNIINQVKTVEEEEVEIISLVNLQGRKVIKNLDILIPAALDEDFLFSEFNIR